MQSGPVISLSPSFNGYASTRLADIAARVIEEIRAESEFEVDDDDDVFGLGTEENSIDRNQKKPNVNDDVKNDNEEDEDDDFEFAFVCREPNSSPISADEIFYNGQIRPIFPIFNTDLLLGESENQIPISSKPPIPRSIRVPLRKLMFEDRDTTSCSSSEADDLDGIPAGTYCVWTPKAAEESPGRCKKSNSTGSSKRWKFRDLLHRSNSDGKDTFVFLTPTNSNSKKRDEKVEKSTLEAPKVAGKPNAKLVAGGEDVTSVGGRSTATNRAMMKDGDRRRSFLPYRQDLVGFFANVNGLSRNLHPF